MKKTVIALAIAAFAATGAANAATVYNQDGTKVELGGSARIFLGKLGKDQRGDLVNDGSRIKINATHTLDNGLSAFVGYETRFNGSQKEKQSGSNTGFGNITTNKLFVGFGFENVGKLSFGRQATTADDVLGDGLYYRSGANNILTTGADKSIKFRSADFEGFSFGADYLFGNPNKVTAAKSYKNGAGVAAFYNYDFEKNHNIEFAAGYTFDQYDSVNSSSTSQKNHNWLLSSHYRLDAFRFAVAYGQRTEKVTGATSNTRGKYIFLESKYDLADVAGIPSTVGLQWERYNEKDYNGQDKGKSIANQYIAMADYKLSKNVVPYVQYTRATEKDNVGQRTSENVYGAGLRVHF
ncbi:porin [uncultured Aggregatibacter sp.]|uniref:porin n=1 Tax=uncultured Aggregatibacter sp. TaxID=470564 RepID=UPI001A5CBA92|nr:porin [uncultured Aggregatibacter sp.]VTX62905.1 Porin-like protein H [uncultured Aggregatibacter sp.]